MANTSRIKTDTNWQEAAGTINANFSAVNTELEGLRMTTSVKMPLFSSTSADIGRQLVARSGIQVERFFVG